MTAQQLDILTYNMHKGFSSGKVSFQLHKMREAIETVNADLVLLQEVQGQHKRQEKIRDNWPDETQFEFIADALWPHYAYGKNAIYQAGHHGNAILSKYPFIKWDNIDVSMAKRASRSVLHGIFSPPGFADRLHVICIHFGLFKTEREAQLTVLVNRIQSLVGAAEPLIIAGDFNDWRRQDTQALETALGMQEVFKTLNGSFAKTFPALAPALQTDRIYFRGLVLVEGHCLKEKPWRALSDHLPLYARFQLPE